MALSTAPSTPKASPAKRRILHAQVSLEKEPRVCAPSKEEQPAAAVEKLLVGVSEEPAPRRQLKRRISGKTTPVTTPTLVAESSPGLEGIAEKRKRSKSVESQGLSSSDESSLHSDSESSIDSQSDLSSEEEIDNEIDGTPAILKDLMIDNLPGYDDPQYTGDWSGAPEVGSAGFNEFADKVMKKAGVASASLTAAYDPSVPCPPLQPHQESAVFLVHPKSPVTRVLVDHPTGSGKTREMIQVLDNYFFDPRPKVPIFPKEPVCQNFYAELLRWPSKYRDFFCCMRPEDGCLAAGAADWRSKREHMWTLAGLPEDELRRLCRVLREVLELKGYFYMGRMRHSLRNAFAQRFPGETCIPGGPLRALRYTSAGGRHTSLRDGDGLPASAMMKIGFDKSGLDKNVYSNKVVIMDEVHNLVRTQTCYGEQLARLRDLLSTASGAVVAGFTGTPILSEPSEGRQLLDIIKGREVTKMGMGDEGYISSFHMRPRPLFPESLPRGVPDAMLTPNLRRRFVKKVNLTGEPLQRYDVKRGKGMPSQRLRAYCNMCIFFGNFHDGKTGSRARIMENFESCAPKLDAIVNDVANDSSKALVLVAKCTGMNAVLARLREIAEKSDPPFGVATMEDLAGFNSAENLRGERYRVMVADATTCSEGVSFFGVRRVLLGDVPSNPSALVQSVGRAIRMYGHRGLSEEEQTVTTTLYVASFPPWMRSPLGAWAYRSQPKRENPQSMESKAKRLLRNLKRVGIRDLETLKRRLDEFVQKFRPRSAASKEEPSVDFVVFLESIGLWEEAKRVRLSQQASSKPVGKRARKAAPRAKSQALAKRHYLIRALSTLSIAGTSAEEVAIRFGLSPFTADEETLNMLSKRSREIVPALQELRSNAVDSSVLGALLHGASGDQGEVSEGESSVCEFDVGSSSGGEDDDDVGARDKKTPIVLPPGWFMHRFQRGSWSGREFVDPQGNVYRSDQQVKKAIEAWRRAENMAARREELSAKFRAKQAMLQDSDAKAAQGEVSATASGGDPCSETTASGASSPICAETQPASSQDSSGPPSPRSQEQRAVELAENAPAAPQSEDGRGVAPAGDDSLEGVAHGVALDGDCNVDVHGMRRPDFSAVAILDGPNATSEVTDN